VERNNILSEELIVDKDRGFSEVKLRVVGIGNEGCKLTAAFSKRRDFLQMKPEDFICVKGIRRIDELGKYCDDAALIVLITEAFKVNEELVKEFLKSLDKKPYFLVLLTVGNWQEETKYGLLAKGIDCIFEFSKGDMSLLTVAEALIAPLTPLFHMPCIDLYDIRNALKGLSSAKSLVIELEREDIEKFSDLLIAELSCRNLSFNRMFVAIFVGAGYSLEDVYQCMGVVKNYFSFGDYDDFYFTCFWKESMDDNKCRMIFTGG